MTKLNQFIISEIMDKVCSSITETNYRTPLVGFANANQRLLELNNQ